MGLWIGAPRLNGSESVVWRKLDAVAGGKRWETPLELVRAVGRQDPDGGLFSGGMRTRLRVDTVAGTELFAVGQLDEVIARLSGPRH